MKNSKSKKQSILKNLIKAKNLLSKPGVWCKNYYGKMKNNRTKVAHDPIDTLVKNGANQFCAIGAIYKTAASNLKAIDTEVHLCDVLNKMNSKYYEVETFNDAQKSSKKVINLFEKAIKEIKKDINK